MLLQRQKETIRPLESYSLFVGPKGGGKSSLLALLQPAGTVRRYPKTDRSSRVRFCETVEEHFDVEKDVAHIWELGGGMKGDGVAEGWCSHHDRETTYCGVGRSVGSL